MPELPEVLTITEDLKKEITNKRINNVGFVGGYVPKNADFFKKYAVNSTITHVSNIAKLITIKLSSNYYIATHLNMSGRLLWNKDDGYTKVIMHFDDGNKLHYSSVRMFGYFEVWSIEKLEEYKKRYGKVALDPTLTLKEFIMGLKRSNTFIKNNLLNQKFISGIGNIYANDALYMSKIHPKRKSHSITGSEYKKLFENVKIILNEGILHRGSTIDRYADLYGNPGSHQNHFRVYGKRNQKCSICGSPLVFEKIQGRGTYYCPSCQREELITGVKLF
ncbi:hypothetical protein COV24_03300 [candidate division WWE3 bacterium CG10_big_fil_rev_8_21_14_0_10_32_10]|uniref:DNA-formamidopyrimidine glycosylase n=1 Tax=candidate division WWE3 bacterium CG10_big_fil_rev_8_21_14_0_10_32_10 TaxID=1975090 RepID=A0A2H0RBC0_UNCKA|nr:MAG: hypothetical protein COV24_03300 [candidate division WWE3 bacterium CG10_big_fil_rev_8_21_14_0_10_32_10]